MHRHAEVLVELEGLTEPRLQATFEAAFGIAAEWEVGGRFRGAHEEGGPHPDLAVVEEDLDGLVLRYSSGRVGAERIGPFALARQTDCLRLDASLARSFLDGGVEPTRWQLVRGTSVEEITKPEVSRLASSADAARLTLVTVDFHE